MQAHDVSGREQRVEGAYWTPNWASSEDSGGWRHSKSLGVKGLYTPRHLPTDIAQSYQTTILPSSSKIFYGARDTAMPPATGHVLMERYQLSVDRQHEHDSVLGHRHGVSAPIGTNGDAGFARPRRFDEVVASA